MPEDFLIVKITPFQISIARKLLGLKQNTLAQELDISLSNYNGIEIGKVDPKLSTYSKIIDYFIVKGIIFHSDGNVTLNKI